MTMTLEDRRLLAELCEQHDISADKVLKLLDTVRDYEFKDRRTGFMTRCARFSRARRRPLQRGQCAAPHASLLISAT